jgi:hypothetical protein
MKENKCFSRTVSVFHGRKTPEPALLVGYGALIEHYDLGMPMPVKLCIVSEKHKRYETDEWLVFTPRHQPKESLLHQLIFALKYEGINLLFFKKLFDILTREEIIKLVKSEPQGQYCRKIWFLYEWLLDTKLPLTDLKTGNYVPLVDPALQFALENGTKSGRHRIVNNLPGTRDFCPVITKTPKLQQYIAAKLNEQNNNYLKGIHKDLLLRTSAFLLLKDSKASFNIEGESPKSMRAARWGQAIGQAGTKELSFEELVRLQQVVIENGRFIEMGFRKKGGFVGEHDRITGEPIPDHISARWQDLEQLMKGLIQTNEILTKDTIDAVIAATVIAFGFVFIHPFEDGNGRIHRYLIHHLLAKKKYTQQGIIFPVSASILNNIEDYRKVLESYSQPLLNFIEWKETRNHNIEVMNETKDYYRFFDATKQAEFLYDCVKDTIENIIPEEIAYLEKYDEFKRYLDNEFEMPDKTVAMLVRFLEQSSGKLSKRAREKEFSQLTDMEVEEIERNYELIF